VRRRYTLSMTGLIQSTIAPSAADPTCREYSASTPSL
jgi:hypothetical protein